MTFTAAGLSEVTLNVGGRAPPALAVNGAPVLSII